MKTSPSEIKTLAQPCHRQTFRVLCLKKPCLTPFLFWCFPDPQLLKISQSVKFQMSSENSNSPLLLPKEASLQHTLENATKNDLDQCSCRVDFIFVILKNFKGEIIIGSSFMKKR